MTSLVKTITRLARTKISVSFIPPDDIVETFTQSKWSGNLSSSSFQDDFLQKMEEIHSSGNGVRVHFSQFDQVDLEGVTADIFKNPDFTEWDVVSFVPSAIVHRMESLNSEIRDLKKSLAKYE